MSEIDAAVIRDWRWAINHEKKQRGTFWPTSLSRALDRIEDLESQLASLTQENERKTKALERIEGNCPAPLTDPPCGFHFVDGTIQPVRPDHCQCIAREALIDGQVS
jgi:hypothetical protein